MKNEETFSVEMVKIRRVGKSVKIFEYCHFFSKNRFDDTVSYRFWHFP